MKSLGEHFGSRYMVEPAGVNAKAIYYDDGMARIVFLAFHGKANRVVFMRDDILVAWTFDEVQSGGGDLTVEFRLP